MFSSFWNTSLSVSTSLVWNMLLHCSFFFLLKMCEKEVKFSNLTKLPYSPFEKRRENWQSMNAKNVLHASCIVRFKITDRLFTVTNIATNTGFNAVARAGRPSTNGQ